MHAARAAWRRSSRCCARFCTYPVRPSRNDREPADRLAGRSARWDDADAATRASSALAGADAHAQARAAATSIPATTGSRCRSRATSVVPRAVRPRHGRRAAHGRRRGRRATTRCAAIRAGHALHGDRRRGVAAVVRVHRDESARARRMRATSCRPAGLSTLHVRSNAPPGFTTTRLAAAASRVERDRHERDVHRRRRRTAPASTASRSARRTGRRRRRGSSATRSTCGRRDAARRAAGAARRPRRRLPLFDGTRRDRLDARERPDVARRARRRRRRLTGSRAARCDTGCRAAPPPGSSRRSSSTRQTGVARLRPPGVHDPRPSGRCASRCSCARSAEGAAGALAAIGLRRRDRPRADPCCFDDMRPVGATAHATPPLAERPQPSCSSSTRRTRKPGASGASGSAENVQARERLSPCDASGP